MKLDIIVRIHDGQNIHGIGKPRYINVPKKRFDYWMYDIFG